MDALEDNVSQLVQSVNDLVQHERSPRRDMARSQPTPAADVVDVQGVDRLDRARSPGLWQTPPPTAPQGMNLGDPSRSCDGGPSLCISSEMLPDGMPSRESLSTVVDLFFLNIHPWCPLFPSQPAFESGMFSAERTLILHGVIVAAARFWTGVSEMQRDTYVQHSRDQILLQSVNRCCLVSTQALALLAVDALGRGTGPHCWNAMSMLVTAARHLGIASNPLLNATESNTPLVRNDDEDNNEEDLLAAQAEEKQRLFWVICSLDRLSSVAHGQPGGIDTKTIRMPYISIEQHPHSNGPVEWFTGRDQWNTTKAKSTGDVWFQYTDLMAFADRCNQLLIQPVNLFIPAQAQDWQAKFRSLDADLSSWFDSLPSMLHEQLLCAEIMPTLLFANVQL